MYFYVNIGCPVRIYTLAVEGETRLFFKKNIKNHEINENKIMKSQDFHKNKLYKMAIFNCFKNKKTIKIYL